MSVAKLSSKSQIVIPASLRRKLGLSPGDYVELHEEGDRVVLRKAPTSFVDALGALGGATWTDYDRELESSRDEWDR